MAEAPWYGEFFLTINTLHQQISWQNTWNARIGYDVMKTILKRIENVINNGLLTYNYTDDLVQPITPTC